MIKVLDGEAREKQSLHIGLLKLRILTAILKTDDSS